ncbi:MAG: virulence RhuM family protein [Nanoarchaeota archaeon]|nr:virulence RhuM family protein [Nanoarchaeota archaeon]MBU1622571.1 virulence RhuM family protein [Nanoarchaeota archaeon]
MIKNQLAKPIEFLIYTSPQGDIKVEVFVHNENIWLTQKKMSELFDVEINTINYHLKEIFKSGELPESSTIRKIRIVQKEGKRDIEREQLFYNLDAIISVGYRVNSQKATQFRIWATKKLKEFIIKGFVLDDDRLKNGQFFGKDYFDELLERIRSIRTSERRTNKKRIKTNRN